MENQSQTFISLENIALKAIDQITQVAGSYRIFEYQEGGAEKKLVALPITVHVTQHPDFLGLELHNESEGTTTQLNYPMNGASYWSEERQSFIFCRVVGNNYVADIISPFKGADRSARTTYRITWQLDKQGRIHEIFEDFDADGNRLESSRGHFRTLVPILES